MAQNSNTNRPRKGRPASTSHRWLTPEQREALGITEGTLRLSIGIENADARIRRRSRNLVRNAG